VIDFWNGNYVAVVGFIVPLLVGFWIEWLAENSGHFPFCFQALSLFFRNFDRSMTGPWGIPSRLARTVQEL